MGYQGPVTGIQPGRSWPGRLSPAQRAVCTTIAQDAYKRVAHECVAIEYDTDDQKRIMRAEIVRLASRQPVEISSGIVGQPYAVGDHEGKYPVVNVLSSTEDCLKFYNHNRIEFRKKPIESTKALELLRKGIFK